MSASPENTPPAFALEDALALLASRESLSREQARSAMTRLLQGEATSAQIGAFLMGLRLKGETLEEITGLVEAMRDACVKIRPRRSRTLDLCGTGGDGSGTFNISTGASLVVSGAGGAVAKHGNRSASSVCGSADVLEELGVPLNLPREKAERALDEVGYAFLFAPQYHPAMRHVAGPRRELRIRTVFNILGPLSSPAGVKRQLVGVFDDSLRPIVARVLRNLGSERVWAVHGNGGLDELSIAGPTMVTEATEAGEREFEVTPEDAGLPRHPLESLKGGDARRNAEILQKVIRGEEGPHRDAVVLNAAAGLVVEGSARDLRAGVALAAEAIDRGAALGILEALRTLR